VAIIDQFSDYQRARGFSPNTVSRRRTAVEGFRVFLSPAGLDRATADDVEEWLLTKPTAKTRHAYRSDLQQFYKWACRRAGWAVNPIDDTDPIKVPKTLPRPIGPEVRVALLTGRRRVRQMVALGLFAGLRCAEIAALDGSDVWSHHDPAVLVVRNGKGGKDRVVPMHPELIDMLGDAPVSGPLFPGQGGRGHVTAGAVSALLSRHLRRCGIEATPHQLRHTFGTEMARAAKGNLTAVAAVMGHESMQTTKGYVGWGGEAAGIIAEMFRPTPAA
jgi:integrase/recombinase XerD